MPSEPHPATELIDEARFMRRMAKVVEVSAEKVEQLAATVMPAPAGPVRLEVPTLNSEGWTAAVLYVVRSERAKATPLAGIAAMLEWMFRAEVTPQVLLAAVMHFDLDRRDEAPTPEVLMVAREPSAEEMRARAEAFMQALAEETVAEQPRDASPVVAHEAVSVEDKPAEPPMQDEPYDVERENARLRELWAAGTPFRQVAEIMEREGFKYRTVNGWIGRASRIGLNRPTDLASRARAKESIAKPEAAPEKAEPPAWEAEARRLYAAGCGMNPYAISKQLGVPDYAVRKAVIPGYGTSEGRKAVQAAATRPAPSLPPVNVPKPQPREPETKPQTKPARRAAADPLPWSPPARTAVGCNAEIPAAGKGLHLNDLQVDHCRWLMGPGADGHETYCGCQKSRHGSSYCDAHAQRAFTEWPPRTPIKRPTRMARSMSALPDARNHQHERTA